MTARRSTLAPSPGVAVALTDTAVALKPMPGLTLGEGLQVRCTNCGSRAMTISGQMRATTDRLPPVAPRTLTTPEASDAEVLRWLTGATRAIHEAAASGEVFQAHDLVLRYGIPEPPNHGLWGFAFREASRRQVILAVGRCRTKRPSGGRVVEWKGRALTTTGRTDSADMAHD